MILDDSDEIETRLPLLNCLNFLEYIWWLLNSDFKRCLILIFNNFESKQPSTQMIARNFTNLIEARFIEIQKYWAFNVLLDIIATTITQLNSLFVLYYWSSWCRNLMNLVMKCAQFINSYQKSTLGRPIMKPFVLQSCFFMYYRGILI